MSAVKRKREKKGKRGGCDAGDGVGEDRENPSE